MASFWTSILTIVILYVLVTLFNAIWVAYAKDLRDIPGPRLNRLSRLPLKATIMTGQRAFYIHELHAKYGPVVRIAPNEVAFSSIAAWHAIHKIGTKFRKDSWWYQNQAPTQFDDDTCGVFGVVNHKKATQRRRLYQQVTTKPQVKQWEPVFVEIIDATIAKVKRDLQQKGKADMYQWWSYMTTDILGEVAFGEPFHMVRDEKKPQLIKDVDVVMILGAVCLEFRPIYNLLSLNPFKSMRPSAPIMRLREAGMGAVRNTKEKPKSGGATIFSKMYPEDDAPLFPDWLMADEACNLIIAGSDTTAMTLTNLTNQVLLHPKVKQKLLNELKTIDDLSWETLENAEYLQNVIQETLRLYPSGVGTLPRSCPEPVMIDGFTIPAGTVCATQAWTHHRNPEIFDRPNEFDPDRWTNATPEMKEQLSTFGGAMRSCLGQNIARLEMLHAVARFFKEFPNVELADSVSAESTAPLDYFVIKMKSSSLEVVLNQ